MAKAVYNLCPPPRVRGAAAFRWGLWEGGCGGISDFKQPLVLWDQGMSKGPVPDEPY